MPCLSRLSLLSELFMSGFYFTESAEFGSGFTASFHQRVIVREHQLGEEYPRTLTGKAGERSLIFIAAVFFCKGS